MKDHPSPEPVRPRILLTGAAGRIGRLLRQWLAPLASELRLVDRLPVEIGHANETTHVADLSDPRSIEALVEDITAIVHFAGHPREADWATLLPANIAANAYLWEAAVKAGVDRIIRVGLEADYLCEIVYGASANARTWWDNRRAAELGYRPRHSADPFIDALAARTDPDAVAARYQGGAFAALDYVGDPSRPASAR